MNATGIKLHVIQYSALLVIFIMNAILSFSFYQLILVDNLQSIQQLMFKLSDFFFLFVLIYLMISNFRIPFHIYTEDDDIDEQISYELIDITTHIFISSLLVSITIVAMYCFNL